MKKQTQNKEEKFEKIVEWYKNSFTSDKEFFSLVFIFGLFLWISSIIWFPFYWIYKSRNIWEEDRKVYWRKIK